jgi:hypothetical protein
MQDGVKTMSENKSEPMCILITYSLCKATLRGLTVANSERDLRNKMGMRIENECWGTLCPVSAHVELDFNRDEDKITVDITDVDSVALARWLTADECNLSYLKDLTKSAQVAMLEFIAEQLGELRVDDNADD